MKPVMKLLSVAAVAGMALQFSASPSQADAITVYVGYADNLRPSGFFPSPWLGAANVVSQSSAAQTFDSGAIRVDNTGATSITITNFQVHFPNNNSTFALWNSLTIAPGQIGIFTQNNGIDTQFDTSDFGVFGANPPGALLPGVTNGNIGGCSSPAANVAAAGETATCAGAVPVITFLENGNPESFSDIGQILDTGGYDFVNQSSDGNESINWNVVGTTGTRGGNVPEPASLALLGTALVGFGVLRRRRKIG